MANASLPTRNLGPGLRVTNNGIEARVRIGSSHSKQLQREKRFPLDTPLKVLYDWQRQTRATLISETILSAPTAVPLLPQAPDGWCYLYVFRSGNYAKVGRSVTPRSRLQQIQTSHPEPVQYIVAVPIHASFEDVVHTYFAPQRSQGEWYLITPDFAAFVDWLQAGRNPLEWFWSKTAYLSQKKKGTT